MRQTDTCDVSSDTGPLALASVLVSFVTITKPTDHVALITLNRPERMNAMAFDVMIPFRETLSEIGRDNDVRVVVITGAGHGFCSGADLEDPGMIPDIDGLTLPTMALRSMELLDEVIRTIRRLHQPVIAAVNGAAIGGGFCLALAADIRVRVRGRILSSRRHQQRLDRSGTWTAATSCRELSDRAVPPR